MWKFKTCPRCDGDLFLDEDFQSRSIFWTCLQCGYHSDESKSTIERLLASLDPEYTLSEV